MLSGFVQISRKVFSKLRFSRLLLSEKLRVAFGAAVIFILAIVLLVSYIWMGQLTKKAALDAGRAKSELLLRNHFQIKKSGDSALAELNNFGGVLDPNDAEMSWLIFDKDYDKEAMNLTSEQRGIIESLREEEAHGDRILFGETGNVKYSYYFRIFRATDSCISCHNSEGSAEAYPRNKPVGAVMIKRPAGQIARTVILNQVCIVVAGLIAGAGAVVVFYLITQRMILSPIRQLRALANNVAEGNLDTRCMIKTADEFERLSNAFNDMLDNLQSGQQKLRHANLQLDEKIAELSNRNIELFKANKLKGEFLANISHEFRTPLNAILGFAEILREKPEIVHDEKGKRYAENIISSGKRLLNMINDLLDLAKTEANSLKLHMESISVEELCKAVLATFSEMTRQKEIKVKLIAEPDIATLFTDAGKVQQILENFMSNAVKFTEPAGRIEIRVSMTDAKHVRFSVSDTGCGIDEQHKEEIFEKFRQVDGSLTRESMGSGLGLAICKELAGILAGDIDMKSEVGKGSTFWLDIPVNLNVGQQ